MNNINAAAETLTAKLDKLTKSFRKSPRHVVRLLNEDEAANLTCLDAAGRGWLAHNGCQVAFEQRANGQAVAFVLGR